VEQSITRFEKRLDEANDALKTLGGHLGTGARGSYKEVTAALTALRRNATKTNKQALKDFDKLRTALTKTNASASSAKKTTTKASSGSARGTKRSSASRSSSSRKTSSRTTASRSTASRSRAKKS
jgi:DNA-binding protein HU-beta